MKMFYRILGRTKLEVSAISIGTVALGISYGIQDGSDKPASSNSIEMLKRSADIGINLFDAAPNYGEAETILGKALGHENNVFFATKVSLPLSNLINDINELRKMLRNSLDQSRRALRRDVLDIVQIHNLSIEHATNPAIGALLNEFQLDGTIRYLGASVYSEDEALSALQSGWVDVLQVAHNILDQRMSKHVFNEATQCNVGVLSRSAFLKGALTPRARLLPPQMQELRTTVEALANTLQINLEKLPAAALKFCLDEPRIHSVLIGPTNERELTHALDALTIQCIKNMPSIGMEHAVNLPKLIDPRQWPLP